MSMRELTSEELAVVAGGHAQTGSPIIIAPPPPEPELPPLPGIILSAH